MTIVLTFQSGFIAVCSIWDKESKLANRDRAAPGPVADKSQPVMSRDRAVPTPGGDGVQTVVGPDSGDMLDGGAVGEKRLISNAVAGGREAQVVENPSEPPPTNPVLAPPQQVHIGANFMERLWRTCVGLDVAANCMSKCKFFNLIL